MSSETSVCILTTGLPGAGKTLRTIQDAEALRKATGRTVYYSGINQLTLEGWVQFGGPGPRADRPWETNPEEWYLLPNGAIIVIVEAQRLFRPQGLSKVLPPYVAALEVLRHQGHTLFLDTQHPTFLDAHVRKLVGTHRHLMRKFGAPVSTIHVWHGGTRDNCDKSRKDSLSEQWFFPKELYGVYKSAESHTVKFRLPLKLWLVLLLPVIIGVSFWWVFYGRTASRALAAGAVAGVALAGSSDAVPGRRSAGPAGASSGGGYVAPQSAAEMYASMKPRIAGLPFTAPRYDTLTAPVRVPIIVGCVLEGEDQKSGWCITQQGTRLVLPVPVMVSFIRSGQFVDFEPGPALDGGGPKAGMAPATHVTDKPRGSHRAE